MIDFSLPQGCSPAKFARLYSRAALYQAALQVYTKSLFSWRKALSSSHDEQTLYDFARSGSRRIDALHRRLVNGEFRFRAATPVEYNFNGKHRVIYVFPWEERIIDRMLYDLLSKHFHNAFSSHCYAYRWHGFGLDSCQRRIARVLREWAKPIYILKRDIENFFPSIGHAELIRAVRNWVQPDDYLLQLLEQRVRFEVQVESNTIRSGRGVAFGSPVACFFANLYLTPLDRQLEQIEGIRFFRYADDLLVVARDRRGAERAGSTVCTVFAALGLTSKPSHHRDFQFGVSGAVNQNKFRHLGLEFRSNGTVGLSRDKARKICNLFRYAFRRSKRKILRANQPRQRALVAIEAAQRIIDRGIRSIGIIDYYLKHVDDEEQLRLIDRWLAEEVLSLAFQNGHRKGNFKRLPFRELRAMGLPSLRHRRRLLRHGQLKSSFFQLRQERLMERERTRLPGRKTFSPGLEAATVSDS